MNSHHPRVKLVRIPRWAVALVLIAAVSLCLLLIVLAAGVALVVIPVAMVVGLVMRWRLGRGMARSARHQPRQQGSVIEGEYSVIDRD